jgi:hypothetical protein
MKIKTHTCPHCKTVLFSRARHDFRGCKCGECFVDGGFDYFRGLGPLEYKGEIELDVTKKELYDDWNLQTDKYGKITCENEDIQTQD